MNGKRLSFSKAYYIVTHYGSHNYYIYNHYNLRHTFYGKCNYEVDSGEGYNNNGKSKL